MTSLFLLFAQFTDTEEISNRQKVYNDVSNSIFTIYSVDEDNDKKDVLGSAVEISDHLLATNCHVALSGNYVVTQVNDKYKLGRLYYHNQENDICLVEIEGATLTPVNIRPSKKVQIGEQVYAIGNPDGFEKTISRGIISNKVLQNGILIALQTDAAISHGSSGGGLFDTDSNLIGITAYSDANGSNIGFAIPTELILNIIEPNNKKVDNNVKSTEPTSSTQNNVTQTSNQLSNNLVRIGYYGDDEIGLMIWNNRCFTTIPGINSSNKIMSLAIWFTDSPSGLDIFSRIINTDDAVKFLLRMENSNDKKNTSKSLIYFDKSLYPLVLISMNGNNYPVYIFSTNKDLTEKLIVLNNFIGQFYKYNYDSGMTSITFGLNEFTEALAASKKYCKE